MNLMNYGTSLEILKKHSINLENLPLESATRSLYTLERKSQPILEPIFCVSD